MKPMKPYIICHMMQSLDGRVACDMVDKISGDEYYQALESLNCQAFVEGKHSYQIHHCGFGQFNSEGSPSVGKESYFIAAEKDNYDISVDTLGTLIWDDGTIDNHICLVSEQVSEKYLDYLRKLGISYIVTGKKRIDLERAMDILNRVFGVTRVAIVGGGKINGSFLSAGLIDEVSVMIAPGIDGREGEPALFDGLKDREGYIPVALKFKKVSTFDNGVIWSRYEVMK